MTQAAIKSAAKATTRGRAKRTSKEKLVRAARNLMLAQGYPITSVDDIIEAAGVSKGSFYHYFDSKEELALTAMHEFLADGAALMMDGPFRDIADPRKRAIAFLKHVESITMRLWDHGCLLVMFSVELAGTSPKVREETSAVLLDLIDRVGDNSAAIDQRRWREHAYDGQRDGEHVYGDHRRVLGVRAGDWRLELYCQEPENLPPADRSNEQGHVTCRNWWRTYFFLSQEIDRLVGTT